MMLRQTPRILHNYLARLESFAPVPSAWPEASHVLESRDASWLDVETAACLRSHGGANCLRSRRLEECSDGALVGLTQGGVSKPPQNSR
ncbi:MAG: hypothetical protein EPO03_08660 [Porticoccaceae bacterium]|nr:MAG: hypothetical protein EPO03_08660 [Porticoccaceae bacterium]